MMIKKSLLSAAVVVVLAVPLFSLAQVMSGGVTANGAPAVVAPMPCYPFGRSLSIGANGSDVVALQNYLKAQGYFTATATGYFGVLTRSAVGQWQAQHDVAVLGGVGSGIFGPLSRGVFTRSCAAGGGGNSGGTGVGIGTGSGTPGVLRFSANPQSGIAPLTVQFIASAPQGTTLGNAVDFGDGTKGNLGFVPVCSNCNAEGVVSHAYATSGAYIATLTSGTCSCPANGVCNCPNMLILATTTVVVSSVNATTTTSTIEQLNSPGTVTLSMGGIAEIRNQNFYFTLENMTSSSATIQITPVGCWNSFPSDPAPKVVCMIALVPIPPQSLSVGQSYTFNSHSITLTDIASGTATFSVQ